MNKKGNTSPLLVTLLAAILLLGGAGFTFLKYFAKNESKKNVGNLQNVDLVEYRDPEFGFTLKHPSFLKPSASWATMFNERFYHVYFFGKTTDKEGNLISHQINLTVYPERNTIEQRSSPQYSQTIFAGESALKFENVIENPDGKTKNFFLSYDFLKNNSLWIISQTISGNFEKGPPKNDEVLGTFKFAPTIQTNVANWQKISSQEGGFQIHIPKDWQFSLQTKQLKIFKNEESISLFWGKDLAKSFSASMFTELIYSKAGQIKLSKFTNDKVVWKSSQYLLRGGDYFQDSEMKYYFEINSQDKKFSEIKKILETFEFID